MTTPVACSLRVAASPLKGAVPADRPSPFRGTLLRSPFAPALSLCGDGVSGCSLLRVDATARRGAARSRAPGRAGRAL